MSRDQFQFEKLRKDGIMMQEGLIPTCFSMTFSDVIGLEQVGFQAFFMHLLLDSSVIRFYLFLANADA